LLQLCKMSLPISRSRRSHELNRRPATQWRCWLLFALGLRSSTFCNTLQPSSTRLPRRQGNWIEVSESAALEAADNATVLPVFPLSSIYWPGTEARLNIIDPAYIKMYDDILLSGSRRFVVPYTRSLPGGRVRYAEMAPKDRRLFHIGSLLYLTDLQEVSSQTGDRVKYVVSHEVQGRVKLLRLLNPSALFETDSEGNKVNYLKAEVEMLSEQPEEEMPENPRPKMWRENLLASWRQLHNLSQQFEEPRVGEDFFVKIGPNVSTWVLSAAWQELQVATQVDRGQKRAVQDVEQFLKAMKEKDSKISGQEALQRVPRGLLRALSGNVELSSEFWEPLLQILATQGAEERGQLLLELIQNELKLSSTRFSLKQALSDQE